MATTWCPDLSADPAVLYVGDAHAKFLDLGTRTYNLAVDNLENLGDILLAPVEFNVSFDYADPQATFHRPLRPEFNLGAIEFRPPDDDVGPAPGFISTRLTFEEPPAFNEAPPTLTFGARPVTPELLLPVPPGSPDDLEIPLEPDYVLPPVPTFEVLQLPVVPDVQLPTFDGERPVFVELPFNEHWTFSPAPYVHTLKEMLVAKLRPMIEGAEALPLAIERAIFERGRSRIELETQRAVEQAMAEFGARGFSEPPGMLSGRVLELRQAGQNSLAEVSRDVAIKQYEQSLENLHFAITQGAALEGVLIQLHIEEQRFALQAAMFQRESAIAVLNARISVFNARLQAYQTDAQVLRERIQAELAKVEVYRAQIEGERARNEINVQRVQLYEAQLRGVMTLADFYRLRIEAVKTRVDIDRLAIEQFKAEIEAYGDRWRAYTAEWQGYAAGVEGEGKRADLYRTLVDANSERVRAWSLSQNLKIEAERLRLAEHGQGLDAWRGGLQRFEALLTAERTRLTAAGQVVDAQARVYASDASVEQTASAAADRSFELGLTRERADVDTQLKVAELKIVQARGLIDQAIEIKRTLSQVSSQLAASTMAAVNYGASISSGRSKSDSCSSNFSFSGEIADA